MLHQKIVCVLSLLVILAFVYGIEDKLLYSTYNTLKEIDLDTGVVRTLISKLEHIYSMAYDYKDRYMYIPRYFTGDIARFSYPKKWVNVHTIVSTSFSYPYGIAFDSVNRHVYWTELIPGKIKRCDPDGSNVILLFTEDGPTVLTLDIQNRWIFFGQRSSLNQIFRINFDGTDKRIIVQNLTSFVYGIGGDVDFKRLYWMEYNTGDLQSAWINGSDVKTIISTNTTSQNRDIDIVGDFIFYTNYKRIMKINKSLGHNPTVLHTITYKIYGLLFYKSKGKYRGEN